MSKDPSKYSPLRKFWNLVLWGDSDITKEQKRWVGQELARRSRRYVDPMTQQPPPHRGQRRTVAPTNPPRHHHVHHECDAACPQQAFWEVKTPFGYLHFCHHHKRKNEGLFEERGYRVRECS